MRILENGNIYLEKGETVPAMCCNCGYIWKPNGQGMLDQPTRSPITCPLCGYENDLNELPAWEER